MDKSIYFVLIFALLSFNLSNAQSNLLNAKVPQEVGQMNEQQIEAEFNALHASFQKAQESLPLDILSMGMSGDYPIALSCGSTMIRVGSKIFGARH